METPRRTRRRPTVTMKLVLLAGVVFIVILTAGLIIVPGYYTYRRNLDDIVVGLNKRIAGDIARVVDDLLTRAERTRDTVHNALKYRLIDTRDKGECQRLFLFLLAQNDSFFTVGIGRPDGRFIAALRQPEANTITLEERVWDPARKTADYRIERYADNRYGLRLLDTKTKEQPYYAPGRLWYRLATENPGKGVWTEPYVFASSKKLGVGTSITLHHGDEFRGVVLVDIELAQISSYLARMDVARNGTVFIVDRGRKLVAFPQTAQLRGVEGDRDAQRGLADATHPLLRIAHRSLRAEDVDVAAVDGMKRLRYRDADGEWYRVTLAPVGRMEWIVGTVIPERDFTGVIERNMENLRMLLPALLLASALTAMIFATVLIAWPLRRLTRRVLQLKELYVDPGRPVASSIREIQQMSDAIWGMETALQSFKRYVPADLVRELLHEGRAATLGTQKRELTILQTSIDRFESLFDVVDSDRLTAQFSTYLEEVTRVLMDAGATVDKYIGDKVQVFWNAPLDAKDHERRACAAALECQRRIAELNAQWTARGSVAFHTRIGIHTGPALVGNIGTSERMSYSLIGDSVNRAVHLTGLNRQYGTRILIGAETCARVAEAFLVRPVDRLREQEDDEGVVFYELVGPLEDELSSDAALLCREFRMGFRAYWERDYREALRIFLELSERFPDDQATQLYIEKCRAFEQRSSGRNWDLLVRMKREYTDRPDR